MHRLVQRSAMNEPMDGGPAMLPVPKHARHEKEECCRNHNGETWRSQMPPARCMPKTKNREADQFYRSSVFRKHSETNQRPGNDPRREPRLILGLPECERRPRPKKHIDNVGRHE